MQLDCHGLGLYGFEIKTVAMPTDIGHIGSDRWHWWHRTGPIVLITSVSISGIGDTTDVIDALLYIEWSFRIAFVTSVSSNDEPQQRQNSSINN